MGAIDHVVDLIAIFQVSWITMHTRINVSTPPACEGFHGWIHAEETRRQQNDAR